MITNQVNTNIPAHEELLELLGDFYTEKFHQYLEKIELIKWMISPERPRAKDLLKDEKGRIIVDIEKLHILEDTDFFRERALYFKKHGVYTHIPVSKNPRSEYVQFWKEERRRCLEGYVRESDGEWIPGYYYFYLNYAPIMRTVVVEDNSHKGGKRRSERVYTFADFWDSDYIYYHYMEKGEQMGMFGNLLKTRGRGYSFKGGSNGARNFVHIKKSKSYMMAEEKEFLDKDGIYNKFIDAANWCAKHTPFPRLRAKQDLQRLHFKAGYTDKETGTEQGWGSEVMGVTMKNDPNKARGKRGKLIMWEESGKFRGLKKGWGIARMSLEDGDNVFGYQIAFGTGGEEGADFESALEMFYYPKGFGVLSMKNIFDLNASGECSLFIPEYLNRSGCYDENGNSDVIKAMLEVCSTRRTVRDNSSDPMNIVQEEADRPITPQEAVMKKIGNVFPITMLREVRSELEVNERLLAASWKGEMVIKSKGTIDINTQSNKMPIRKYPIKDHEDGCVEIFEMPYTTDVKKIQRLRYIAGCDPVDDDGSETGSLISTFIMDTVTKRVVAEYTGRPNLVETYFEQLRLLLEFYNATLLYENNKKGLYTYFKNKGALHLLAETPESLKDVYNVTIHKIGNKKYGVNANQQVNAYAISLTKKWLLEEAYDSGSDEELDDEGNFKLNLHSIKSLAFLDELISWNAEGNFDRVSAIGMLLIYLNEVQDRIDGFLRQEQDAIFNDPFYQRVFGKNSYNTGMKKINKLEGL